MGETVMADMEVGPCGRHDKIVGALKEGTGTMAVLKDGQARVEATLKEMATKQTTYMAQLDKMDSIISNGIVADVIKNYDELSSQYEIDQKPIRERAAYKAEADPIYIEWQALLATEHPEAETRHTEWLAKRAEIKERFK